MLSLVPTPVARPISVLPACRPARKGIHGGMACAVSVRVVAALLAVLGMVLLRAADLDSDSLDDAWEASHGYNTLLYTRIVYVDAADGSDSTGDGLAASTAFQTIGKAARPPPSSTWRARGGSFRSRTARPCPAAWRASRFGTATWPHTARRSTCPTPR